MQRFLRVPGQIEAEARLGEDVGLHDHGLGGVRAAVEIGRELFHHLQVGPVAEREFVFLLQQVHEHVVVVRAAERHPEVGHLAFLDALQPGNAWITDLERSAIDGETGGFLLLARNLLYRVSGLGSGFGHGDDRNLLDDDGVVLRRGLLVLFLYDHGREVLVFLLGSRDGFLAGLLLPRLTESLLELLVHRFAAGAERVFDLGDLVLELLVVFLLQGVEGVILRLRRKRECERRREGDKYYTSCHDPAAANTNNNP